MSPIQNLTIGLTGRAISLVAAPRATLSFDLCGRPIGINWDDLYFVRGLDGRFVEKKWLPEGGRARRIRLLAEEEALLVRQRLCGVLEKCLDQVPRLQETGNLQMLVQGQKVQGSDTRTIHLLNSLLAYNIKSLTEDEIMFKTVYRPIGILPPDQYLSLVIQVTEGCSWNRCAFCHFYRDRPARVRTEAEIRSHISEVKNYFGASLPRRCSIFLGDANAMDAPADLLLRTCEELARVFPEQARPQKDGIGGIYCFGEARRILQWSPEDLRDLGRAGMRRIYIGLETGDDALRRWAHKPGTADDARRAVERVKAAGMSVGLVSLLGLGGRKNGDAHTGATSDLLNSLPLDERDILYFSPIQTEPDYDRKMAQEGWTACTDEEKRRQMEAIIEKAKVSFDGRMPVTALYDIREFVY